MRCEELQAEVSVLRHQLLTDEEVVFLSELPLDPNCSPNYKEELGRIVRKLAPLTKDSGHFDIAVSGKLFNILRCKREGA